jgi:hypothetical protein
MDNIKMDLREIGWLFNVKCKWEHKVKGDVSNAPHTDV